MTRSFGIARKLLAVCLAFGLPIAVMLVLMTKAKLGEIEFAEKELDGDAFQRPLEDVLNHVSRHRLLWVRSAHGDAGARAEMAREGTAVSRAVEAVEAAEQKYGQQLLFTPEGLGLRNRTEFTARKLHEKWDALSRQAADSSVEPPLYRNVVQHVRTMITHSGDSSNLILDPDLDSYYLMDVTLLALPPMEERIQELAVEVENLVPRNFLSEDERMHLATVAAFLSETDWDRAAASTNTAINEDANFHGTSPSLKRLGRHVQDGSKATERVAAALKKLAYSKKTDGFDIAAFRAEVDALSAAVYRFHADALDEEDRLLQLRTADFEQNLRLGFVLAGLSVLVSAVLASILATNIVRRVRRISATTKAVASGDMGARVGAAGSDELGELARSFDAMANHIGGLTAEVNQRAEELQRMNDNLEKAVLGRTRELQERNDAVRLILDNAHDGLLTVDLDGKISKERSATVDRWFGVPRPGATLGEYLGASNPTLAAEIKLGLEEIAADILPLELLLDQLPRQTTLNDKHLHLAYQPIGENGKVTRLLVVISDVTSDIENERAAARQEEILRVFHACQRDRSGFLDFFVDAREIVQKIVAGGRHPVEIARLVHTLKGNCALFGVLSMSGLCHDVETNMAENGGDILPSDVERLRFSWEELSATVTQILGERSTGTVEVADEEYAAIVDAIARGAPRRDILAAIARWKLEPTERRLSRFAERAKSIARRLGKDVDVTIEANDVRVCAETWSPVWSALTHVVRNAIDHGIETPAERREVGKAPTGQIRLKTNVGDGRVFIEVSDDGKGVEWDLIRAKAKAAHLPFSTKKDLVDAVFADGISTKASVTDLSGRGVGMAAVREACTALGGAVEIESEPSKGTTIRCSFPEGLVGGKSLAQIAARQVTQSLSPME